MDIEEHPHYRPWRQALEDLLAAKRAYREAEKVNPSVAAAALAQLKLALDAYHAVAIAIVED